MAEDKLKYFDVRARGEAVRMLYALAGKPLNEERVTLESWPTVKADQPLGQLPVFECAEGTLLMSNTIARHVAKKLGLAGGCLWEEALNDMVVETCVDYFPEIAKKIYSWSLFKRAPEPEDPEKVKAEVKEGLVKAVNFIQSVAEKRGKKFIVDDKLSLADVWLFASLEFAALAFPDSMELTPWIKEFTSKARNEESMKKYLADRPESALGI